MTFADAVNPTDAELRAWAYSDDLQPMEDWELIVALPENLPLAMELVADQDCPKRTFFLQVLYCAAAEDLHRAGSNDVGVHWPAELLNALTVARASSDPWLTTWSQRTQRLIDHPETFVYEDWFGWQNAFYQNPIS